MLYQIAYGCCTVLRLTVDIATKSEPPSLSVRFSANLVPDNTGEYHFELVSIGSARLKIDGEEIVDNWTSQDPGEAFFSYGSAPRRSSITLEEETKSS